MNRRGFLGGAVAAALTACVPATFPSRVLAWEGSVPTRDVGGVTIAQGIPESTWREGDAYCFTGAGDWNQMFGNFAFGYRVGYRLTDVEHCTLVQCGADGFLERGVGFMLEGKAKDARLIACQSAGQRVGFLGNGGHDRPNEMVGCSYWANVDNFLNWN